MTVSALVSNFILPALGGLAVGFISGVAGTLYWVGRRCERGQPVPIYTDDNNPTPGGIPIRGREHLSRLGWVLVIAGVLGFVAGVIALVQNNNTADCVARFTTANSSVQLERAEAAGLDRQAVRQQRAVTRETIRAMVDLLTTSVDRNDAAAGVRVRDEFLAKIRAGDAKLAEIDKLDAAAEQQRRENPLPAPPRC